MRYFCISLGRIRGGHGGFERTWDEPDWEEVPMQRYVIIGNGMAGISAAETIRSLDREGTIVIIAREEFPPYSRPLISMVLEGSIGPERLPIRSPDFYRQLGSEALIGHRAVAIEVDNRHVVTDQGRKVPYDRLLIASGADPRPIKAAGRELANISFMRTEAQVRGMLQALPEVTTALVLGGGLVGFKAAYGLLRRGIKVTMLIRSGYPLSMQLDATAGALILEELAANGLEVRVGVEVTAFEGNGRVRTAHLSDGSRLDCQLVVVGKGVLPALDFVPRAKIQVDLGIVVDDHLQTSAPGSSPPATWLRPWTWCATPPGSTPSGRWRWSRDAWPGPIWPDVPLLTGVPWAAT